MNHFPINSDVLCRTTEPMSNFDSKEDVATMEKVTVEPIKEESPAVNGSISFEKAHKRTGSDTLAMVKFSSPKRNKSPPLATADQDSDCEVTPLKKNNE